MFIAMNRFRVTKGSEEAFEKVWLSRDTHLDRVPGFVEFHLLKGPEAEDHTLYASHTVWWDKAALKLGPSRQNSVLRTRVLAMNPQGRFIWITRNSKALRCVRR